MTRVKSAVLAIGIVLTIFVIMPTPATSAPPVTYGWNIGAADILAPGGLCRLGVYLDDIAAMGYDRSIRIIYTPVWGPQILRKWIPIIRAKGFRVLVILSQDGRGGKYGDDSLLSLQVPWIATGLPPIADILDGVQIANEPDGFSGKSAAMYRLWHEQMVALVRATVPAAPIIGPDLRTSEIGWIDALHMRPGVDYDILNFHVTHLSGSGLKPFLRAAQGWGETRAWITEGDWSQAAYFMKRGLTIERSYLYVYNGHEPESRRKGPDPVCP